MSGHFNHRKSALERFRFMFRAKPDRFFARLEEQARLTAQGTHSLRRYMEEPTRQNAGNLHDVERQADEIRRILIEELNRTFATPIDREDIFSLSRAIDDVLDYADTTVVEMEMLSVKPNNFLLDMAELLAETADEIQLSVARLQHHPAVANEHAMKAKSAENRIEDAYRKAIADLFHSVQHMGQVIEILKLREVYRHLSNAADRGDEAANIISDIIVKIT